MKIKKLKFKNLHGIDLSGILQLPESPVCFAILIHCFTCGKDLKSFYYISDELTKHRIGVLRFDFTGIGDSKGDFSETTLKHNVEDILAATKFLGENYAEPALLIGHSLGGTAAIFASQKLHSLKGVVLLGTSYRPSALSRAIFANPNTKIFENGVSTEIAGKKYFLNNNFFENLMVMSEQQNIADLSVPLLIVHSYADETVSIEEAFKLFNEASHPKSFVTLLNANHLFSKESHARTVANIISSWCRQFF